jgi:hypothetical protein
MSRDMQSSVEACRRCHAICRGSTASTKVSAKVEPRHLRLRMAVAEICRTSAVVMLAGTPQHRDACAECAEIWDDCAEECRRMAG